MIPSIGGCVMRLDKSALSSHRGRGERGTSPAPLILSASRATRAGASQIEARATRVACRAVPAPRAALPQYRGPAIGPQVICSTYKPHLLRPLAMLPLSLKSIDPVERLGTYLSSLRMVENARWPLI